MKLMAVIDLFRLFGAVSRLSGGFGWQVWVLVGVPLVVLTLFCRTKRLRSDKTEEEELVCWHKRLRSGKTEEEEREAAAPETES
jgi:hypothetical protein